MRSPDASLLRQVSIFASLDTKHLELLAARSRRRSFAANATLFYQGDPGSHLYVVIRGCVRIQRVTPSGEVIHVAMRGPGEPFGEMSLIDGKPRMADAVTAAASDLLILEREDFVRCLHESPQVALGVMTCLADRLREAAERLDRSRGDVLGRVASTLLELAAAHGVEEPSGGQRINLDFSQQDLAAQVGTTRESASRALSSLRRVHAIARKGRHWVVLDPRKLRGYCAE